GEGRGEVGAGAVADTHLTLPALRAGPLPLRPAGRRGVIAGVGGAVVSTDSAMLEEGAELLPRGGRFAAGHADRSRDPRLVPRLCPANRRRSGGGGRTGYRFSRDGSRFGDLL